MSEKKYIFKIDRSKYLDNWSYEPGSVNASRDIKMTCDNCLLGKEIKIAENYKD